MFLLILLFTSGLLSEKSKDLKTTHYPFHVLSAQFVFKHLEGHTYTPHTHTHLRILYRFNSVHMLSYCFLMRTDLSLQLQRLNAVKWEIPWSL